MTLFRNKYRIEAARLKGWDYGTNASYFVTICTQNRKCFFGKVEDGKMKLSESGIRALDTWEEIPVHYPFAFLSSFVIMPNHMHGILIIDKPNGPILREEVNRVSNVANHEENIKRNISTPKKENPGGITGNHNPMIQENLSRIIRWYKGRVSYEIKKTEVDFGWQPRFHDSLIRTERSFENIRNYIKTNPANWPQDKFHPQP